MIEIRLATVDDRIVVEALLLATSRHYWGPKPDDNADAVAMADAILSGGSDVRLALAWADNEALGYATFALLHPAPSSAGTLFLKDLFVAAAGRSQGVGRALMGWLANEAVARGCIRFDWTAETDNPRALAFYDRLGAGRVDNKVYYRITGDGLARFAAQRWRAPGDD